MTWTVLVAGPTNVLPADMTRLQIEVIHLDYYEEGLTDDRRRNLNTVAKVLEEQGRDVLCVVETNDDRVARSWSPSVDSTCTVGDTVPWSRKNAKGYKDPRKAVTFWINKRAEEAFEWERKQAADVPYAVADEVCGEHFEDDDAYDAESVTDEVMERSGAKCARDSVLGYVTGRITGHLNRESVSI